jgi:hypothetical protein
MAALIVSLALLTLLVALGVAAVLDLTPDTRDPEFGLGPVLHPRQTHASATSNR